MRFFSGFFLRFLIFQKFAFFAFFLAFPPSFSGNRVHIFFPPWLSVPKYGVHGTYMVYMLFFSPLQISMASNSGELVSVVAVEDVEDVLKDELEVPESPPNCCLPPKSITHSKGNSRKFSVLYRPTWFCSGERG